MSGEGRSRASVPAVHLHTLRPKKQLSIHPENELSVSLGAPLEAIDLHAALRQRFHVDMVESINDRGAGLGAASPRSQMPCSGPSVVLLKGGLCQMRHGAH